VSAPYSANDTYDPAAVDLVMHALAEYDAVRDINLRFGIGMEGCALAFLNHLDHQGWHLAKDP
jgi:hypothetical protein